jgi:hypothetical protein
MKLDPQKVINLANRNYAERKLNYREIVPSPNPFIQSDQVLAVIDAICESINQMSLSSPSIEKPKMDMPCKHHPNFSWQIRKEPSMLFWCPQCGSISEGSLSGPKTWTSPKP